MKRLKRVVSASVTLASLLAGFLLPAAPALATACAGNADIFIGEAAITGPETVFVYLGGLGSDSIGSVDPTKWHIDINDTGLGTLDAVGSSIYDAVNGIITLTFPADSFGLDDSFDSDHGLYADPLGVCDTPTADSNIVTTDANPIEIFDRQPPPVPVLTAPYDGALVYDISTDWDDSDTAVDYHIQIDDDSGFGSPEIDTNTFLDSFYDTTLGLGTYYWHVAATDGGGYTSNYSPTRSFTVTDEAPAEVFVSVFYFNAGQAAADGHSYNYDAFLEISDAVEAVAEGGTVNVGPGEYNLSDTLEIEKPLSLLGPGIDPVATVSFDDSIHAGIVIDTCNGHAVTILTASVSVEGFYIAQTIGGTFADPLADGTGCNGTVSIQANNTEFTGNDVGGGYHAVSLRFSTSGATITGNRIHHASNWGLVINSSTDNIIEDNDIYNSDIGIQFRCGGGGCDSDVSSNSVTFNDIHDNDNGVGFDSDLIADDIVIASNSIADNGYGMYTDDEYPGVSARYNFWGDFGPYNNDSNLDGQGNEVDDGVQYRPFYLDAELTTPSSTSFAADGLEDAFDSGAFSAEGGDPENTTEVTVNEDVILTYISGSSVELSSGTSITQTGGGAWDAGSLIGFDEDETLLTGLGSGVVAHGALVWGADVGLTFSPAITLNIFVGAAFNGQTLDVRRSPDGGNTWTQDGIEAPKTCLVASGICTFEATKASVYVATTGGGGGGGSNGGGGYYMAPQTTPTPMPGTPAAKLALYNLHEGDTVRTPDSNDPDIYIVNEWGYKRLFLNPIIFNFYGHLGWAKVRSIVPVGRDAFPTSGLFRNCESNDQRVFAVEVTAEDSGMLHHVQMSGAAAAAEDPDFFHKVFCINNNEFNWYPKSSTPYTSLSQVPPYTRR